MTDATAAPRPESTLRAIWVQFRSHKGALFGLIVLTVLVLAVVAEVDEALRYAVARTYLAAIGAERVAVVARDQRRGGEKLPAQPPQMVQRRRPTSPRPAIRAL